MKLIKLSSFLIIDDSTVIQNALRALLSRIGVPTNNISCCPTAGAAVGNCKRQKFDVLFVDHNLGHGSTGLQMLEQLKLLRLITDNTLIYIVTGNEDPQIELAYSDYMPAKYIQKPIRPEEIIKVINHDLIKRQFSTGMIAAYTKDGLAGVKPLIFQAPNKVILKDSMLKLASRLIKVNRLQEALSVNKALLSIIKESIEADIQYAEILLAKKEYKQANQHIDGLLQKNKDNLQLIDLKAEVSFARDDIGIAARFWKRGFELSPYSYIRFCKLVWSLLAKGEKYDAFDLLTKYAYLLPNSAFDSAGKRAMAAWGDLYLASEDILQEWSPESAWQRVSAKLKGRLRGIPCIAAQRALSALFQLKINRYGEANRHISDIQINDIADYETAFIVYLVYCEMKLDDEKAQLEEKWLTKLQKGTSTLAQLQTMAFIKQQKSSSSF
ncbi:response regulator [Aliivibrio fischeri]|uniref:response regulator n=1 Tax=Aliivibrio fischeri TaxID=668 RepID=UPI0012DADDF6|nr:response regulator [Aliivibrio fischeri]MUK64912.1 response regulator [Aliivibrio fischeri]